MTIQTRQDLEALRVVGRAVGAVLRELSQHVVPGVTTAELDLRCAAMLARERVRAAPRIVYGFPGSICISVNDEAVHGVPGPRVVREGDLVKLDLVAERDGYFADAAVTVPVPPIQPVQRRLVRCARRAFRRALDVIRPGRRVSEIGRAVQAEARRAGFAVIPELGGHGVGRAIHELPHVPNFADPRDRTTLHEGLVIAVEPIVSAGSSVVTEGADGWTMRTRDGSHAAHHEHTLVVTRDRPLVLTQI